MEQVASPFSVRLPSDSGADGRVLVDVDGQQLR
jgi:hypothetical protein